jgi:sugar O-acyltransferase (sialic acid O-acetyltransferase NeuD family)
MKAAVNNAPKVIFGAGKQAAQILNMLDWMGLSSGDIVLFDDAFPDLQIGPHNLPVVGKLEEGISHCIGYGLPAMVALGSRNAAVRYAVFRKLLREDVAMPNLIHSSSQVAPSANLGQNIVIMPGAVISSDVVISSLCWLYSHVTLEHDTQADENVVFGPSVVTSGYVKIGKHAFLGTGSVYGPGVTVGERALIGAGAVVVSDIPQGVIAAGVPARVLHEAPPGLDVPTLEELSRLGE